VVHVEIVAALRAHREAISDDRVLLGGIVCTLRACWDSFSVLRANSRTRSGGFDMRSVVAR
jgi:hypothetical protein